MPENPKDLTITRLIDAPRKLVFQLWVEPRHLSQWFAPKPFSVPRCELDARKGGKIHIVMAGPGGIEFPMSGEYDEVVPQEKLVYTTRVTMGGPDPAFEVQNTIVFEDERGKTKLTMTAHVIRMTPEAGPALSGQEMGWTQTLNQLASYAKMNAQG